MLTIDLTLEEAMARRGKARRAVGKAEALISLLGGVRARGWRHLAETNRGSRVVTLERWFKVTLL